MQCRYTSTGLNGTPELTDILGFLEEVEGFGDPKDNLGNIYDDSSFNGSRQQVGIDEIYLQRADPMWLRRRAG
jgi:hypothetical protein